MNRKLLRSVREYKRESFLTPVLVCLEVLMEVLIPLLMANIIDVGLHHPDRSTARRNGDACACIRCKGGTDGCNCIFGICEESAP